MHSPGPDEPTSAPRHPAPPDEPDGAGARPPTLPSLTGLRVLAALVVFVSHARWLLPSSPLFQVQGHEVNVRAVMQQGDVGVSLFFLLSGLVLHWSRRPGDPTAGFLRRRAARLYPLQATVWAGWIVLGALAVLPTVGVLTALVDLALLQAWVPVESVYWGVNPPTWSLSCEVFFYALFPLLSPRVARLGDRALPRLVVGLVLAAIGTAVVLQVSTRWIDPDLAFWAGYIFPPTRLLEFAIGIALAEMLRRGRWRSVPLGWALAFAGFAYVVDGRAPRVLSGVALTLVPFVLLLLAAAGRDLAGRPSFWRTRPMQHLGVVSFAFFLVQFGVIQPFRDDLPRGATTFAGGAILVVGCLLVSWVLAEVLHVAVERPAWRALTGGAPPPIPVTTDEPSPVA